MPMETPKGFLDGSSVSIEIRSLDLVVVDDLGNLLGSFDIRDNPEVLVTDGRFKIGDFEIDFEPSSAVQAVFLVERIRSLQRSFLMVESNARVEYSSTESSMLPKLEVGVLLDGAPVTIRLGLGDISIIDSRRKALKRIGAKKINSILRAPFTISLKRSN